MSGSRSPDQVVVEEVLAAEPAVALAGVLDIDLPDDGVLPALWHWVYLLERRPQRDLGRDGHPTEGIPAPPGPGRRRMFAGGRVRTLRPLALGRPAVRTTRVASVDEKAGRSGPLTFVTLHSTITQDGQDAVVEEQDIVYRERGSTLTPARARASDGAPHGTGPRLTLEVDTRLLFRFSALTYNAHRIHYDRDFVGAEGYADLVVHGPLQALMMAELFRRNCVSLLDRTFGYRLVAPMIGPQTMTVGGIGDGADPAEHRAEVRAADGTVTARARLDAGI